MKEKGALRDLFNMRNPYVHTASAAGPERLDNEYEDELDFRGLS